jgi:CheY-like chemotaxis protein
LTILKTILLIDDDEDDQEIFLAALERKSKAVSFTGEKNARTALDKLAQGLLNPDMIFLDLNMPVMNGIQFLGEIKTRERIKNIPIIVFSTTSQSKFIKETSELGASGFITKPDNLEDLAELLSKYIQ